MLSHEWNNLYAQFFLQFQGYLSSSCHENEETDDYESNFNFDYCGNEINENEKSNDRDCENEHEQNIIEMGIEVEKRGRGNRRRMR